MSRPLGVSYNLTSAWAKTARSLAQSVDARLLLGINLEANRTRIDQVEAAQLLKGIGRDYVDALEIGNEPALYPLYPWYRRLGGSRGIARWVHRFTHAAPDMGLRSTQRRSPER
jgi:hypothetical protein